MTKIPAMPDFAARLRHPAVLLALVLVFALGLLLGRGGGSDEPAATSDHAAAVESPTGEPQLYTCSMHPSVRLTDPNAKCPICFMDLIPVRSADAGPGSERRLALDADAAASARVETAPVERFFPTAEVRLYGKVTYDETVVARLTAYFAGRIERLFVNYVGVPVAEGDHIAELYSPELLTAFEELRQVKLAQSSGPSSSEIVRRSSREMLEAAREKLRLLGVSAQQIEAAENGQARSDRLTVYSPIEGVVTHLGVREGDYVQTGSVIATVADLDRLWLDLEAYESQLSLLRWGQDVRFTVEAHAGEEFEGRIAFIEPMVDERTRTAAVRIAVDNSDHRLKPGMFASALVRVRVGDGGAVVSDALAGRWVSPMHPTVVKDGPGQCDVCGMDLVPAEQLGVVGDPSSVRAPLVVPSTAVLFTGKRSVVYVEVPGTDAPTYEGREVEIGPRAGDFYVVRSGLTEGERVVTHGAFRVDSAMQILAKPSMMMPREDPSPDASQDRSSLPEGFRDGVGRVIDAYLRVQVALAADDAAAAAAALSELGAAVTAVPTAGIVGERLGEWRRIAARLDVSGELDDLSAQRARLPQWSEAAFDLVTAFGHGEDGALARAHCPMAFDGQGADWLQRDGAIDNPYFGASMLRCGEIVQRYPSDESAARSAGGHDHD